MNRAPLTLGFLLLVAGCVPKASMRQTDVMQQSGAVSLSAVELRARINDLADRLAGRIAVTADRIGAETQDPVIRRRALVFKTDAIPALYTAAFRADPLTATVDVWALAFQIDQYLEDGAGREAFGPQQRLAREGAQALLADTDAAMQGLAATPERYTRARARIEGWAKEHPLEYAVSTRSSAATLMAQMRSDERDTFAAVGAVSDTLENLSEELNIYANLLPKEGRWQAELLVADLASEYELKDTLSEMRSLAGRADDLMSRVPEMLGGTTSIAELVANERRAVLAGVDTERLQTLEYMTTERLAILTGMREERVAALEALRQERIATLQEAEAMRKRAWEDAMRDARTLVNDTLLRVAVVLLVLMAAAAMLGVIGYRLTLGRSR